MKVCTGCKMKKPLTEFGAEKGKPGGLKARCKPCARASNKISYDKNPASRVAATLAWKAKRPEHVKTYMSERRRTIKRRLVDGYGGKCTCCGEETLEFLTLEHVNGGGREHRKVKDSLAIFNEVIREGFPREYTILCMNCNFAKRFGKDCPHATGATNKSKIDALVKALEFYADPKRYDGPNMQPIPNDIYAKPDAAYIMDVTRDGGSIARKALAVARPDRSGGAA
jgi:hypothetical protein